LPELLAGGGGGGGARPPPAGCDVRHSLPRRAAGAKLNLSRQKEATRCRSSQSSPSSV
jgi:hypothetical protein